MAILNSLEFHLIYDNYSQSILIPYLLPCETIRISTLLNSLSRQCNDNIRLSLFHSLFLFNSLIGITVK